MPHMEHLGQYDPGVSYKKIVVWFVAVALVLSLGTWYFVLSQATISITPKTEVKKLELSVTIDARSGAINQEKATIPGHFFYEEGRMSQNFKDIPPKKIEESASGKIAIHNEYTRAQGFKEGDILLTEGAASPQKIMLTANTIVYRNQTKTVDAVALDKGLAGNIPPGKFVFEKHDDFMRKQVWAESTEPFQGGVRTASLITEGDISTAKNELLQKIYTANLEKIKPKLYEDEELNQDNSSNTITFFHSDVAAPLEATGFNLEMAAKTTAVVFRKTNLRSLIEEELRKMEESDQEFLEYDPESLAYKIERISSEEEKAYLKVNVSGKFRPKLSTKIFDKEEIRGFNERAVQNHYKNFPDVESVSVSFWPRFRKTVPDMDNRIIIEIKK